MIDECCACRSRFVLVILDEFEHKTQYFLFFITIILLTLIERINNMDESEDELVHILLQKFAVFW